MYLFTFVSGLGSTGMMRGIVFGLSLLITCGSYVAYRSTRKKHRREEERQIKEIYQKDENGLYPWESDTDDSPNRVSKEAKAFRYDDRPKRGGW